MKKILLTICTAFSLAQSQAQVDAHFSQYYAFPLWMNPAMTGAFDGGVRVAGIYRNQWHDITSPFSTAGLSADFTTGSNINIGINLMNQTAGDAGYRLMNGGISIAYSGVRLGADGDKQILLGLQAGFISRRFDPSRFQFGDQWNAATGFNPATPSADVLSQTSASAFDAAAGIAFLDRNEDAQVRPFAGFSVAHLTQPEDPFVSGNKTRLPMRFIFHGGARINVSETATITPNILYMRQGTADEKMIGAVAGIAVNETTDILFGANYRFADAIAPLAGFRFSNLTLGLSYDSNLSNLGKMAGTANSFELSLTFTAPRYEEKGIPCPRF
jgi:type IX secretion system PorP/SprF family membrane protein